MSLLAGESLKGIKDAQKEINKAKAALEKAELKIKKAEKLATSSRQNFVKP